MRGIFSLIQYCPDFGRMECANVGVVLVTLPYEAHVKMSPDNEVPKHRGFVFDDEFLTLAKTALASRIRHEATSWVDPKELEAFRRKEGNSLVLTAPKAILLEDPETELDKLFEELVQL
jgi:hypothetical protein